MMSLLVGLVMLGSVSCVQHNSFTLTLSTTAPTTAKAEPCDFRVVNIPPRGPFEEIATSTPWEGVVVRPEVFKKVACSSSWR